MVTGLDKDLLLKLGVMGLVHRRKNNSIKLADVGEVCADKFGIITGLRAGLANNISAQRTQGAATDRSDGAPAARALGCTVEVASLRLGKKALAGAYPRRHRNCSVGHLKPSSCHRKWTDKRASERMNAEATNQCHSKV